MDVRLIFGKPLPKGLRRPNVRSLSWTTSALLLVGAGVVTWAVAALLRRDRADADEMIYFWPE